MVSKIISIVNPSGLHARPAAVFAKRAGEFASAITVRNITKESDPANATSMIALMVLGATPGNRVEIAADGIDEQTALDSLVELLEGGCGE